MTQSTKTPELLVEKLVRGELDEKAAQQVRQRLENEGELNRIDAIQLSDANILNEYPPAQLAASIQMRHDLAVQEKSAKRWMWLLPLSAAVAAAAVMLFMVMPMHSGTRSAGSGPDTPMTSGPKGHGDYWGIKGDPLLNLGRKTADGQVWLKAGAKMTAGDEIQIKFGAGQARSLVICSVDGRGAVTLHFPQSEGQSTRVKPMSKHVLPYAYTLDDAPEFERFIMVWSENDTPVVVGDVLKAVESMQNARTDTPALHETFRFKDFTLNK